jgi:hypothetical protein
LGVTGAAPQGEAVPPCPASSSDEPESAVIAPPEELDPPIIVAEPDELDPPVIVGAPEELDPPIIVAEPDELDPPVIVGAPEELELAEPMPVMPGDPEPPELDEVDAPEPAPLLDPAAELDAPAFEPDELDPFAMLFEPGCEEPGVVWFPVESVELPHAAMDPESPQRTARVVRWRIVSTEQ